MCERADLELNVESDLNTDVDADEDLGLEFKPHFKKLMH